MGNNMLGTYAEVVNRSYPGARHIKLTDRLISYTPVHEQDVVAGEVVALW